MIGYFTMIFHPFQFSFHFCESCPGPSPADYTITLHARDSPLLIKNEWVPASLPSSLQSVFLPFFMSFLHQSSCISSFPLSFICLSSIFFFFSSRSPFNLLLYSASFCVFFLLFFFFFFLFFFLLITPCSHMDSK